MHVNKALDNHECDYSDDFIGSNRVQLHIVFYHKSWQVDENHLDDLIYDDHLDRDSNNQFDDVHVLHFFHECGGSNDHNHIPKQVLDCSNQIHLEHHIVFHHKSDLKLCIDSFRWLFG